MTPHHHAPSYSRPLQSRYRAPLIACHRCNAPRTGVVRASTRPPASSCGRCPPRARRHRCRGGSARGTPPPGHLRPALAARAGRMAPWRARSAIVMPAGALGCAYDVVHACVGFQHALPTTKKTTKCKINALLCDARHPTGIPDGAHHTLSMPHMDTPCFYFSPRRSPAPSTPGSLAASGARGTGAAASVGAAALWKGEPGAALDAATVAAMHDVLHVDAPRVRVVGGMRFSQQQVWHDDVVLQRVHGRRVA